MWLKRAACALTIAGMAEPTRPKKRRARNGSQSDSQPAIDAAIEAGVLPRKTYRLGESAAMLGISRWMLDRLIEDGDLGIVRLGSLRVVPAEDVERLLTQGYERRSHDASA